MASGTTPVRTMVARLDAIRNSVSGGIRAGERSTCSIRASGGGPASRLSTKLAIAAGEPPMWMVTPSPSFATDPRRPCACASRQTAGRKPTPCTKPRTRTISPISLVGMTRLHRADLDIALDVLQIRRDGGRDQNAKPDAGDQPSNAQPGTTGGYHPPRPAQSSGCVTHDSTFPSNNSPTRSSTVVIAVSTAAVTGSFSPMAPWSPPNRA